ncbi:Serine/threonine-protein kinase dst1 OS=Dictyostelium discoideum GN=dst1 PE=3 SV=1 [Rhizoctonia solani AG-1 IB]|uniref:Serine/threonine-protein kinase dst1 n=1 Tax=Thanatephorus cucumeris (strain AG1-IB / isolate 7/3/14) TaxID=1108050 RepID=A0A0B7G4T8_THACB|nr:Serine/threonine-protein kinase dst1 OS=Dictyostelium discoideum GN=dst1 PE=3 SV=1 [Rhizoctonia solani AG-1 IB]
MYGQNIHGRSGDFALILTGLHQDLPYTVLFRMIDTENNATFLARGAAADVWRVYDPPLHLSSGQVTPYVSKVLRISPRDFDGNGSGGSEDSETSEDETNEVATWDSFVKVYREKVSEWTGLRHSNLVRVYSHEEDLNLHIEFCQNGCVRDYLMTHDGKQVDKMSIISDILVGLEYLHTHDRPIIHGNINAGKIFVDADGKARIGEFGLAALCYSVAPFTSAITFAGFSRWMSPELLDVDPDDDNPIVLTTFSDIWALGCTIFEIVAEKLPYFEYVHDLKIQRAILKGEHPGVRGSIVGDGIYAHRLWPVIESCWSMDPGGRPSIRSILTHLSIGSSLFGSGSVPGPEVRRITPQDSPYSNQDQPS